MRLTENPKEGYGMAGNGPDPTKWLKSSYSGANGGDCIEIAPGNPGAIPVRDSKPPDGLIITFTSAAFSFFVTAVKRGTL
ncbi:DUF397 domain-containing protein [Streptomyces sp. NPDC003077]|uniref:DUF397 domain-containing protein n=1 Tax=Streptomyces sp. NPDC003077 TaxID=3154443 RepID=UPI0033B811DD